MLQEQVPDLTKQKLAELVDYVTETVKQGVEFSKEQAPLIAQEMIKYGWVINMWNIAFGIIMFTFGIFGIWYAIRVGKRRPPEWHNEFGFLLVVPGMVCAGISIAGIALTVIAIEALIKIHTAPRLYVLEQIQTFL